MRIIRLISIILVILMAMTGKAIADDSTVISVKKVPVFVDNKPIKFGKAIVQDGTTYVPVNPVFEQMGYKVDYDAKAMTVKMTKGEDKITIGLSENTISGTMMVNGEPVTISGFISNSLKDESGITLIPVRSITESLNCEVVWDSENVWVYSHTFKGEKKKEKNKEEVITEDDLYITTISKILDKQQSNCSVDYITLTDSVSKEIREFHSQLKIFLNRLQNTNKVNKDYKSIDLNYYKDDWKALDKLSASLIVMHRNIDRLNANGLIDNSNQLKMAINAIYAQ